MNTNEDFKEIYEKYLGFSVRIAKQIVKDEDLAEDVSQEVFYHLYSISDSIYFSDEKKLRALITIATTNKAKDYFKKNYVKKEVLTSEKSTLEGAFGGNLEEIILRQEDAGYRRKALQKLKEKNPVNYEILIKVKYLDMATEEVAKEYGITRNSVNNRILRTKMWLSKELLLIRKN